MSGMNLRLGGDGSGKEAGLDYAINALAGTGILMIFISTEINTDFGSLCSGQTRAWGG